MTSALYCILQFHTIDGVGVQPKYLLFTILFQTSAVFDINILTVLQINF